MSASAPDQVSKIAGWLSLVAASVGAVATLAAWLDWAPGAAAFRIVLGATLVATLTLILGLLGLWRTRHGRRRGRAFAVTGVLIGVVWTLAVLSRALAVIGAPALNDVTTDLADPPGFSAEGAASKAALLARRSLAYPREVFATLQREHHPDLDSIRLNTIPKDAAVLARAAMRTLGWRETFASIDGSHLEATATSTLFRFVDDVVVRIEAEKSGVIIDIRSRSRVGKNDLGANAARIRAFVAALAVGPGRTG